jgi:excinuclease ABC subunit A
VVTGVSGSGKSSLVFDTLYAEGQRRYVETFSPYARQFLDRMDKPQVDRIEGVPPAIAIDQTNPVRTSRSTVGTMTELNDHLKLLFARAATLHCRGCAQPVRRDTPGPSSRRSIARAPRGRRPACWSCFPVPVPEELQRSPRCERAARAGLHAHPRAHGGGRHSDRRCRCRTASAWAAPTPARVAEAVEAALRRATAVMHVREAVLDAPAPAPSPRLPAQRLALLQPPALRRLRHRLQRAHPQPVLVQLAARRLRDLPRLRPRDRHRLRPGDARRIARRSPAARSSPGRPRAYKECQDDLAKYAAQRHSDRRALARPAEEHRHWVIEGDGRLGAGKSWPGTWYGVRRFFAGWRARPTRCTSACCCRATALHALPRLRRRAAEARRAAVALGARGGRSRAVLPGPTPRLSGASGRRRASVRAQRCGAARPAAARPDAAADRARARLL